MNIDINGVEALRQRLDSIVDYSSVANALGKACALVERTAKQKAPKGNGDLRRSIKSRIEGSGTDMQGVIYTPLEYAPYVEYGTGLFAEKGGRTWDLPWSYQDEKGDWHSTSGQAPQPFMRPALDENREQIKRIIREGLLNG